MGIRCALGLWRPLRVVFAKAIVLPTPRLHTATRRLCHFDEPILKCWLSPFLNDKKTESLWTLFFSCEEAHKRCASVGKNAKKVRRCTVRQIRICANHFIAC